MLRSPVGCNTNWPEIQTALLPGEDAQSRPDLVARVFSLKLKALLQELTTHGIFGRCVSMLMVVDFQKRGKLRACLLHIYQTFGITSRSRGPWGPQRDYHELHPWGGARLHPD